MRIGQLQAAAITTGGLASIDQAFQLFNIPMFFDSYSELDAVLTKLTPILKARLEAKGFILLGWGHGGWVYFFSKTPVRNVDELKKTKMFAWAGDQPMIDRWKSNGFQPVPLAATDILTGLQTGMIDSYPTTPLLGLTLQWYKQTPYMVGVGLAPLVGGLVMSKQAWNKLSEDDQERIILGSKRLEMRLHADVPKQDTTAIGEMQKRGLKIMTVSPAELAQYRATAQAFAVTMRGSAVPSDILDIATRERDAYRQSRGAKR